MDFKVVFKDSFILDLERIITSIAAQNPIAAKRLGEHIIEAAESLSFFPERFPKLRQRPEIRRFVVKDYKVFYRVLGPEHTVESSAVGMAAAAATQLCSQWSVVSGQWSLFR